MSIFKTTCPLDCPDVCSLVVTVEDNKIVKIQGNPDHPITKGFTCSKAQKQVERTYSQDRITSPLLKTAHGFKKIDWPEVYQILAEKISAITDTREIMYWYDSGHGGILGGLSKRFFNALGGVTRPVGSLCWGAIIAAQKYDFGANLCHEWSDMLNSKTIIVWGKNPAYTNLHQIPYLKAARENGAQIILIDPIRTKTAEFTDQHINLKPGTDGALALGMAFIILEQRLVDLDFISNHVTGFEQYARLVKEFSPDRVETITGVPVETIADLAVQYAKKKPSCILLGYGLQRYANSGNTIRAIDALGAITGNIGTSGGGVNHANQVHGPLLNSIDGDNLAKTKRFFVRAKLGEEILNADPGIKLLFVAAGNPLTQVPNTNKVLEAFASIDFKVVLDYTFTDTAVAADLILPVATVFEREDVVVSSWSPYVGYTPQIVKPNGLAKPDYQIFMELAEALQLDAFQGKTVLDWLEYSMEPAGEYGITLELLKENGYMKNPLVKSVPWADRQFLTPSQKYELYSETAVLAGHDPLPIYQEPKCQTNDEYPLIFITAHPKDYMHSQFRNTSPDGTTHPYIYIHPETAKEFYLSANDWVTIESPYGQMTGLVQISSDIRHDAVLSYQGSWRKEGGGVNQVTPDIATDMGLGTAYYDCPVTLRKVPLDSI